MEIRSIQELSTIKDNVIEGYAIVFNRESEVLYDRANKKFFKEIIEREAITDELIKSSDVKCLINHNKERMVARSRNGEGSLLLDIDDYGVKFLFEIPQTTDGQDLKALIERRDFDGCSFAFIDEDVEWEVIGRDIPLRKVKKIRSLHDVSIVADPAYSSTEVTVRQIEDLTATQTQDETTQEIVPETIIDNSWREELSKFRTRI